MAAAAAADTGGSGRRGDHGAGRARGAVAGRPHRRERHWAEARRERVPVREALRLLESHGIVVNEPYKGIRLRPLTNRWVKDLVEARTSLETSAAHRAVDAGHHRGQWVEPLKRAIADMD